MEHRYEGHTRTARTTRTGSSTVHDGRDRVRTRRLDGDVGVVEAHRRFGGIDVPATLAGMAAALGTAVLLAGLLA